MKYELRENQGIPAPLLALMAVATGLSVANCYYNQPLLGSMAKEFAVSDFSASMVATLTQIGYVVGLVFVIPLGDLDSRKKLIQANYIISLCALLAIALAPNIYWVWGASLVAGASTVVFNSNYVQKYGARFFSVAGGCVLLAAWLLAFWGNDSYLWIIIAILLIDAGMQCIHLSNQTSVVALDASAINRINTVYMTIYFLGGSAGTFVSGLSWQHYGWTVVVGVGVAFTVASLLINCIKPNGKPQTGRVGLTCET